MGYKIHSEGISVNKKKYPLFWNEAMVGGWKRGFGTFFLGALFFTGAGLPPFFGGMVCINVRKGEEVRVRVVAVVATVGKRRQSTKDGSGR